MKEAIAGVCLALSFSSVASAQSNDAAGAIEALNDALQIILGVPENDGQSLDMPDVELMVSLSASNGTWLVDDIPLPDARLVLPVDTLIALQVTSTDLLYDMSFAELGLEFSAIPGRIEGVMLMVHTAGLYHGVCKQTCGSAGAPLAFDVQEPESAD